MKSRYLNNIINVYNKYIEDINSLDNEVKKYTEDKYSKELIDTKKKEYIAKKDNIEIEYKETLKKLITEEVGKLEEKYANMVTGEAIKDDISLFNTPGISLNEEQLNILIKRYIEPYNILMLQAINNYININSKSINRNKLLNINVEDPYKKKKEIIESIGIYAENYRSQPEQFELIKNGLFSRYDNDID